VSEALETWPDSAAIRYNLACFSALAGRPDEAMKHLTIAVERDRDLVQRWSEGDSDLDSLRGRPDWPL